MPSIHISEHTSSGGPNVTYPPLAEQVVPIGAVSQQSKPFTGDTRMVVLQSDVACRIAFGPKPEAGDTSTPLTPNVPRPFPVEPGQRLAVIESDAPPIDGIAGFFAILGDAKAAEKRYTKITAAQKALDATVAENRAVSASAAADRVTAEKALAEAKRLTDGLARKTQEHQQQVEQLAAQKRDFDERAAAHDAAVTLANRKMKERDAAMTAAEAVMAERDVQSRKDAEAAATLKAELERRVANARKLATAEAA